MSVKIPKTVYYGGLMERPQLSGKQQQVEWLVLVDDNDKEGRMLLQRRSMKKKLWPAYWDVSVTSHVYKGETYEGAGIRRSKQELNVDVKILDRKLDYTYWAKFGDYSENEFCVLLTGKLEGPAKPNPEEIMETKYITMDKLGADMSKSPEKYTPWFKIAFEKYAQQKAR